MTGSKLISGTEESELCPEGSGEGGMQWRGRKEERRMREVKRGREEERRRRGNNLPII